MEKIYQKPIRYEDDNDILFKPTAPAKKPAPRIVAIGALLNGAAKSEMVADAAMNGGKDGVIMLPEFNAVYVGELEAMAADLAELRAGLVEPVASVSDDRLEEIEAEHIGQEFSTRPWEY